MEILDQKLALLFGILSVAQMIFLPGVILLKFIKLKNKTTTETIVLSFGLSLVFNYQMIFLLSSIGILFRELLFAVLLFEMVAFFWLYRKSPWWNRSISVLWTGSDNSSKLQKKDKIIQISLLLTIIIMSIVIISNAGKVFEANDAVFSWNRWAVQWFNGKTPVINGWLSPQLIPSNWSIVFYFTNSPDLQFFARFIMPIFLLVMALALYDLARIQKYNSLQLSSISTVVFFFALPTMYVIHGLMELPVAFFSLISVYMLLRADAEESYLDYKRLILAFIFAAGAALTKQEGMFFAFFFTLALFDYLRKKYDYKTIFQLYIILGIIMVLMVLPWYAYALLNFDFNKMSIRGASSNLKGITGVPFYSTPFIALRNISAQIGALQLLFVAGLNIYSAYKDRVFRKISFWFILPYLFVWMYLAGKVPRNLNIIIPFLGMGIGVALPLLFNQTTNIRSKIISFRIKYVLYAIVILFVLSLFNKNNQFDKLHQKSYTQRSKLGDPQINIYLEKYFKNPDRSDCKVITNYQYMMYVPSISDRGSYHNLHDTKSFKRIIPANKSFCLVVLKVRSDKSYANNDRTREYLDNLVKTGRIRLKDAFDNYRIYERVR